ncbi:hypothetical protein TPHA_0A01520 [Tetrapisispora phaffii CBS 4417]|uniref:Pleckstrin homology domain-containing protein n=1 Tax=Tetrapisispora phaffii (strain ATCC 24235 / CBS 4417 / NBRC 1672 / NRRL Y-8282 / UCD 70-5) TaxID=1071381 RepID=G8BMV7_TETPH|nr:hypothetical protein TPHA_0A01520 [Tetrapisispora phaffii CBS 4417]CCE61235.1 hypothetical protein TPHA_0A01520 [Tetrapisispora phaffii CBS 4417]
MASNQNSTIKKQLSISSSSMKMDTVRNRVNDQLDIADDGLDSLSRNNNDPDNRRPFSFSNILTKKNRNSNASILSSHNNDNVNFVMDLSDNLLHECRKLQSEIERKSKKLKRLDEDNKTLTKNYEILNSKFNTTQKDYESLKTNNWELESNYVNVSNELNQLKDHFQKQKKELNKNKSLAEETNVKNEALYLEKIGLENKINSDTKKYQSEINNYKDRINEVNDINNDLNTKVSELQHTIKVLTVDIEKNTIRTRESPVVAESIHMDNNLMPISVFNEEEQISEDKRNFDSEFSKDLQYQTLKSNLTHAHQMIAKLKKQIVILKSNKSIEAINNEDYDDSDDDGEKELSSSNLIRNKGMEDKIVDEAHIKYTDDTPMNIDNMELINFKNNEYEVELTMMEVQQYARKNDCMILTNTEYSALMKKIDERSNMKAFEASPSSDKIYIDKIELENSYLDIRNINVEKIIELANENNLAVLKTEDMDNLKEKIDKPSQDYLIEKANENNLVVLNQKDYELLVDKVNSPPLEYIANAAKVHGYILINSENVSKSSTLSQNNGELSLNTDSILISRSDYQDMLNDLNKNLSKEEVISLCSKYNIVPLPEKKYDELTKGPNKETMSEFANLYGYIALPREDYDVLKSSAEYPSNDVLEKTAKARGLSLVKFSDYEVLLNKTNNPSKKDVEAYAEKLGLNVLTSEDYGALVNKFNDRSVVETVSPSSKVLANKQFFEKVIREENSSQEKILKSTKKMGFVTLSSEEYSNLKKNQKDHIMTKTDIYNGAKDYDLTVLPTDEYKSLLKRKNTMNSISFDDIKEYAANFDMKLTPLGVQEFESPRKLNLNNPESGRGASLVFNSLNNSALSVNSTSTEHSLYYDANESLAKSSQSLTSRDGIPYKNVGRLLSKSSLLDFSQIPTKTKLVNMINNVEDHDNKSIDDTISLSDVSTIHTIASKDDQDTEGLCFDVLNHHAKSLGYKLVPITRSGVEEGVVRTIGIDDGLNFASDIGINQGKHLFNDNEDSDESNFGALQEGLMDESQLDSNQSSNDKLLKNVSISQEEFAEYLMLKTKYQQNKQSDVANSDYYNSEINSSPSINDYKRPKEENNKDLYDFETLQKYSSEIGMKLISADDYELNIQKIGELEKEIETKNSDLLEFENISKSMNQIKVENETLKSDLEKLQLEREALNEDNKRKIEEVELLTITLRSLETEKNELENTVNEAISLTQDKENENQTTMNENLELIHKYETLQTEYDNLKCEVDVNSENRHPEQNDNIDLDKIRYMADDLGIVVLSKDDYAELINTSIQGDFINPHSTIEKSSESREPNILSEDEIRNHCSKLGLVVMDLSEYKKLSEGDQKSSSNFNHLISSTLPIPIPIPNLVANSNIATSIPNVGEISENHLLENDNKSIQKDLGDDFTDVNEISELKQTQKESQEIKKDWSPLKEEIIYYAHEHGLEVINNDDYMRLVQLERDSNILDMNEETLSKKAAEMNFILVNIEKFKSIEAELNNPSISKELLYLEAEKQDLVVLERKKYLEMNANISDISYLRDEEEGNSFAEDDTQYISEEISQIKQKASSFGYICVPGSSFVPTTSSKTPDSEDTVLLPSSYYQKLLISNNASLRNFTINELQAELKKRGQDSTHVLGNPTEFAPPPPIGGQITFPSSGNSSNGHANNMQSSNSYSHSRSSTMSNANSMRAFSIAGGVSLVTVASFTEPSIIPAVTQTVIGEYLFKYYRRLGHLGFESRHEKYFWVHPYTLTLYWSSTNPVMDNVTSRKTKGVAILGVESINDTNPYPVGLYHKSIIVKTEGRSIKITCPTRQRHNVWYNSLRYLLQRNLEGIDLNDVADDPTDNIHPGNLYHLSNSFKNPKSPQSEKTRKISKKLSSINLDPNRARLPNTSSPLLKNTGFNYPK